MEKQDVEVRFENPRLKAQIEVLQATILKKPSITRSPGSTSSIKIHTTHLTVQTKSISALKSKSITSQDDMLDMILMFVLGFLLGMVWILLLKAIAPYLEPHLPDLMFHQ